MKTPGSPQLMMFISRLELSFPGLRYVKILLLSPVECKVLSCSQAASARYVL
jgi:hypothetical protein